MAPDKLAGKGKRRAAQLKWNQQMRLALHVMATDFNLTPAVKTTVFNDMFKDHITACGLTEAGASSISAQYSEKRCTGKAHLWSDIINPPSTPEQRARRQSTRESIANVLRDIGHANATQTRTLVQTPQPPPFLSRKRSLASITPLTVDNTPESSSSSHPKKLIRRDPIVLIPTYKTDTVESVRPAPRTPKKRSLPTPSKKPDTVVFLRRNGPTLYLTPARSAKARLQWVPPSEVDVRPTNLPTLFYRFWDDQEHVHNSSTGFIAGRYTRSNVIGSPPLTLDPSDVLSHIDGLPMSSPFVSVSSNLAWTLRNAMKRYKEGRGNLKVCVMDSSLLDAKTVHYARPYIERLQTHCPFTDGKQRYFGSNEFLIWHAIPGKSIIATFDLEKDVVAKANSSPTISDILRLNLISQRKSLVRIRQELRDGNVKMSQQVAAAIGDLTMICGLSHTSPCDQLSHLVSEIVAGFAIAVDYKPPQEWRHLAACFGHTFSLEGVINIRTLEQLHIAFLIGCSLALGDPNITNFHARQSVQNKQRILRKSKAIGLENPAAILCNELDAAKLHLMLQHKSYERLLSAPPSQRLLADGVDVDEEDEQDDERSMFEIGEDGVVL